MANIVTNKLTITDEKTDESRKSLLDFEKRGRDVYILEDKSNWNEYKEIEIDGKKIPYIIEDLNMQNFIPQQWFNENYDGPRWTLYSFVAEKKIDFSGSEESYIVYTYDTKWAPNWDFVHKVSELYPKLIFTYHYHGEAAEFSGNLICKNGKTLIDEYSGETDYLLFENEEDYRSFIDTVKSKNSEYRMKEGLVVPDWECKDDAWKIDRVSLHYTGDTKMIITICVEWSPLEESQDGIAGYGSINFA